MKISIIIPIYDNIKLTINCLESIARFSYYLNDAEVIIVDDGPGNNDKEYFTNFSKENKWLIYHQNPSNQKFAKSCNTGANLARGEYLIFLNNDTVVTENWDKFLVDAIECDINTWMAGAKLLFPDGTIQHAGVYLPEFTGKSFGHVYRGFPSYFPPSNLSKELQCVTAACMIMRRADFLWLGGFDPVFQNGSEDIDLCLRIISLGKKIRYQPACVITHFESKSEGRYQYSKQNAEILHNRWKDHIKPDLVETINEDIRICMENGLLNFISNLSVENSFRGLKGNNNILNINDQGNLVIDQYTNPISIQLPEIDPAPGDDLLIIMACSAGEKTNVTLRYKTGTGYQDDRILNSTQIIYQGENLVLFSLKTGHFSGQPVLYVERTGTTIEITSFKFYTYKNVKSDIKSSLYVFYLSGPDSDYVNELVECARLAGMDAQIKLINLSNPLSITSINSAIASSKADYILILDEGVRIKPGFLKDALDILELQSNIGFVYSDVSFEKDGTSSLCKFDFNPLTILNSGNTDIQGVFRKKCWEELQGFNESLICFKNFDLFLGILASGNWKGYKIKYPAFSLFAQNVFPDFNYKAERDKILARHDEYLSKERNKIIARELNSAEKASKSDLQKKRQGELSFTNKIIKALMRLISRN